MDIIIQMEMGTKKKTEISKKMLHLQVLDLQVIFMQQKSTFASMKQASCFFA